MDQEFDGKGLTPYDPAHNSTYILAGKNNLGKKYWGLDLGKERKIKGGKIGAFPEVKGSFFLVTGTAYLIVAKSILRFPCSG